ncbi:heme peroxidase [Astrocystis sublimbata]|nr:heme peroxidase [Astrocystis sublimbata]
MRWNSPVLSAMLLLTPLVDADPTWPSQNDELEEIMYQVKGYRARQFGGTVIPCSSQASGPGRHNAAEWVRAAFHDMATTTIAGGPRKGGLDGSLQYEITSSDNIGPAFNTTLKFMADYYTSRSSVADLLALGVYYAVRSCGGPVVPVAGGRIDAKEGGPIGVPLPQNSPFTFEQQFLRMGFDKSEMIQVVACGHTIGGVHETEFPQIVPVGSTANGEGQMDSTVDVFDNKVVTEYVSGNTTNPLVVGPSVRATRNSDFKVFNSDQNQTISAMTEPATFRSICARVLRKMIEVVPAEVVLTDPIQPYAVKPVNIQLTLNPGASTLQLSGFIRVRTTDFGSDSAQGVILTYKDRSGSNNCGSRGCTYPLTVLGATQGFDDTFVWFPINIEVPASSGISSFTLNLQMASGTSRVYDNNGNAYPIQDGILVQKPQSCLLEGRLQVVAGVRNDLKVSAPVNLHLSYKTPVADPNRPIPTLNDAILEMEKYECVGLYTLYSAVYEGLGDLAYATKVDVVTGAGTSAAQDTFKAASDFGAKCIDFQAPPASMCSRPNDPGPTEGTSSSTATANPTVTSPRPITSTTDRATSTSTTTAAEMPSHRQALGDFRLAGCNTEPSGARALAGASFAYDGMTLESCMKNCTGFYYWGTEYGRECYCGNTINVSSKKVELDQCSMVCSGDATEYCGAGNRLELYASKGPMPTPATPTHKPTVSSYDLQGCWTEGVGMRALDAKSTAGKVTLESCAAFCKNYHYFGTEFGDECHCGNSLAASANLTALAECNMPCAGDASEFCGAGNRLSLYYSATTDGPSQPLIVSDYSWSGCRTEATGARALAAKTAVDGAMTLEKCAATCKGFKYFGTEYGTECYCGNDFAKGSVVVASNQCNMECGGNAKQFCGAGNRLSVYQLTLTIPKVPVMKPKKGKP